MSTIDARLNTLIRADGIRFWETLGIEPVFAEPGHVRLQLEMKTALGTFGRDHVMHGGAVASLIDSAASAAVRTTQAEGEPLFAGMATTDLNVSYLEAATGTLVAEARVVRAGRSVAFATVEVRDAENHLVALGRATMAIRRG